MMTEKITTSSVCPAETNKIDSVALKLLVERFKNGDKKTFSEIWDRIRPLIWSVIRKGIGKSDAEDLSGDVCIKIYEGLKDYQETSSFVNWVYTIVTNIKIDYLREFQPLLFSELMHNRKAMDISNTSMDIINKPDKKTPLRILIEREDAQNKENALELLPKLMDALSPQEQYLIYASIYDNRTDEEISLILEGNASRSEKYKKMRQRALKKLGRVFVKCGIRSI